MKKFTVLSAFVFLFGIGSAAIADTVNYNDIVVADGAAANDGGTAVAVKDNLNNNQLGSNNSYTSETSNTNNLIDARNDPKNSYNQDKSKNNSTNTAGFSLSGFGSASNVGEGKAEVNAEYHAPGEVKTTTTDTSTINSNNHKTNSNQADSNNKYEVEVEHGDGNAVTMEGDASVDSRNLSTHRKVNAKADKDSIAAINTEGNILLDKSTTILISDVGLALQTNSLSGEVSHNELRIGGPHAKSETKSGETKTGGVKTGEAKTGEAKSGDTKSGAGSGSLSGAGAFAAGDATAVASSESSSDAKSGATGGSATSGSATSGSATGGSATGGKALGAAALATVAFTTGNNSFTAGSFNGIATFNVNSGVYSLQQSPISINAVVGGGVATQ